MPDAPTPQASAPSSDGAGPSVAYRIVRGMLVVLFFWMFWKFGGFLLNALVGRLYRSGQESDAYFFAAQVVVYGLIFSRGMKILIPTFTPIFIEEKNSRGEERAWDFAVTVFNLTLVACAVMMLALYVFAEPITSTMVPGMEPSTRAMGIRLLKLILPGAALMLMYLPVRAVLNSYKVFSYPAAAEATQKLAWAVGLFVTYRYLHLGLQAVGVGFLIGSAGMMAVTLFGVRRHARHYSPTLVCLSGSRVGKETAIFAAFALGLVACVNLIDWSLPEGFRYGDVLQVTAVLFAVSAYAGHLWLRARHRPGVMARFAALAAPLVISTAFAAYRDTITFYFQSFTARGVFSDIEYARRIAFLPTTMVAYALSVAMFPYLCELAGKKDMSALGGVVGKAIRMLALGFVPLTVMTIILADPVCRLVLDRGDWADVHLHYTALALALLSLGMVMYAVEYVIMQGYFSLQRMWTPALMGIAATLFQFTFLAVPIYVLGYDFPVHIFFLTTLAFPVSRFFKNLILLAILRRRLPILPAGPTLLFAAKLAVLTAAIGAATWGVHAVVRSQFPYEQYRQHKVVVDSFETGPDTWFSVNAREIGIVESPDEREGLCVMMRYDQRMGAETTLDRNMTGLPAARARLEFSLWSDVAMDGIHVTSQPRGVLVGGQLVPPGAARRWNEFAFTAEGDSPIESLHFRGVSKGDGENVLYIDDVRLVDVQTGEVLWSEDFDTNGWTGADVGVVSTTARFGTARHVLRVPPGAGAATKDVGALDLSGVERFRCRLMSVEGERQVSLRLSARGEEVRYEVDGLRPGEWRTVDLTWEELGLKSAASLQAVQTITLDVSGAEGDIYLDDVTFRRPPRRMYEVLKLVHCALPTLAGLVVGLVLLLVLRFQEVRDVREWVRQRGWRSRKGQVEEPAGDVM